MTDICVSKLTIVGSDNGLSPDRRQAIICTNAGILLIGPLETNSSENLIGIQTFSFCKMHLKMSSAKWRPFFLDLNVLTGFIRHLSQKHTLMWQKNVANFGTIAYNGQSRNCILKKSYSSPLDVIRHSKLLFCNFIRGRNLNIELCNFANPAMRLFYIPQLTIYNRNVGISVLNDALWDAG